MAGIALSRSRIDVPGQKWRSFRNHRQRKSPNRRRPTCALALRPRASSPRSGRPRARAAISNRPGGDITVTGASLAQWAPAQASFEVAQANPGLCAVLENAALRFASGQAVDARRQLEEGIESDHDTKLSLLAWLALFDLLQRQGDRAAFDQLALQYVMQFERSAPAWEGDTTAASPRVIGGSIVADRQADGGRGDADRGHPARRLPADARRAHRSLVGNRFRRHRRASSCQCAGRGAPGGTRAAAPPLRRSWTPRLTTALKAGARRARARGCCRSSSCNGPTTARRSRIAPSSTRWRSSCPRRRGSRPCWRPSRRRPRSQRIRTPADDLEAEMLEVVRRA